MNRFGVAVPGQPGRKLIRDVEQAGISGIGGTPSCGWRVFFRHRFPGGRRWGRMQAAADRLSPEIIRNQLDYWRFLLGPKFSKKERGRMNRRGSTPSRRSNTAATSSSNATFRSTKSSEAAKSDSGV